jgi:hypothetical protein
MLGAIAGDVIGSVYEGRPIKSTDKICRESCFYKED